MTAFVIVGAVGLVVMVGCFVAVIHTARREVGYAQEEIEHLRRDRDFWQGQATAEDEPVAEVERLRALLHVQQAANEKLRERIKQLHWEKSEIWAWLTAPEEAEHGTR